LARELGQKAGIRVMGVAPGVFHTGMTDPPKKTPQPGSEQQAPEKEAVKKERGNTGSRASVNPEMIQYPARMGRGHEFARLAKEMIENPMLNGFVVRLDGAVRMPSRL
jgi:3-hydroxyacyl-CoA dehydrogenase / 3-hydroxy-2-methylbutyryl-CoA dehydrogenase